MRNKLMWFYQEVDEPESVAQQEQPKPGPSRAGGTSNPSKTPQGDLNRLNHTFAIDTISPLAKKKKTNKK